MRAHGRPVPGCLPGVRGSVRDIRARENEMYRSVWQVVYDRGAGKARAQRRLAALKCVRLHPEGCRCWKAPVAQPRVV